MEIRDEKLYEAVMALPNSFNEYKRVSTERFEKIEAKLDDAVFVNFENGDGQRMKVANILPKMHKDLKDIKGTIAELNEIKQATGGALDMIIDFSRVHTIFKKYKIYQTILLALGFLAGINIWDLIKEFAKLH